MKSQDREHSSSWHRDTITALGLQLDNGPSTKTFWATEYCRNGNCLASAQHSGLSAPLPHQSTRTAGWQLPAQRHNLPSATGSPGTQRAQHRTACDPRKKHVWMTRHTSGGTSYLLNHLQNMQKKHRQNKLKLNHYGIQCFSKQTEFTLENSKERGVFVHGHALSEGEELRVVLCVSHILCHMSQSFPFLGLSSFWCLRVWGGTAKNNVVSDLDSLQMKLRDGNRRSTVE